MKPVLAFLAAFVVAAGASTGTKVMLTKPTPHQKAGVDSTKEGADSTQSNSRPNAAEIAKVPGFAASSTLVTSDVKPAAKAAPSPAPKAPPAPVASDSLVEASERRLAKVFTAMEAKQAAKVLQHMEDADVQIILGYVGPRQAASIMAELPPERVATLSKLAMQSKVK
jgi:hypothetical protein